ncbi:hypothetical protein BDY21DRAFT_372085 [Lineolata rhizophorae]|uniref:Uncharacterized protein n=1 Tax=Lineolata rhizophorae TaxID=578093 RepID=A0A6A6P084_9PEZI|nr:hypothetical protein BDY21DRAFT_372085 [Lineolata rhizophorae]
MSGQASRRRASLEQHAHPDDGEHDATKSPPLAPVLPAEWETVSAQSRSSSPSAQVGNPDIRPHIMYLDDDILPPQAPVPPFWLTRDILVLREDMRPDVVSLASNTTTADYMGYNDEPLPASCPNNSGETYRHVLRILLTRPWFRVVVDPSYPWREEPGHCREETESKDTQSTTDSDADNGPGCAMVVKVDYDGGDTSDEPPYVANRRAQELDRLPSDTSELIYLRVPLTEVAFVARLLSSQNRRGELERRRAISAPPSVNLTTTVQARQRLANLSLTAEATNNTIGVYGRPKSPVVPHNSTMVAAEGREQNGKFVAGKENKVRAKLDGNLLVNEATSVISTSNKGSSTLDSADHETQDEERDADKNTNKRSSSARHSCSSSLSHRNNDDNGTSGGPRDAGGSWSRRAFSMILNLGTHYDGRTNVQTSYGSTNDHHKHKLTTADDVSFNAPKTSPTTSAPLISGVHTQDFAVETPTAMSEVPSNYVCLSVTEYSSLKHRLHAAELRNSAAVTALDDKMAEVLEARAQKEANDSALSSLVSLYDSAVEDISSAKKQIKTIQRELRALCIEHRKQQEQLEAMVEHERTRIADAIDANSEAYQAVRAIGDRLGRELRAKAALREEVDSLQLQKARLESDIEGFQSAMRMLQSLADRRFDELREARYDFTMAQLEREQAEGLRVEEVARLEATLDDKIAERNDLDMRLIDERLTREDLEFRVERLELERDDALLARDRARALLQRHRAAASSSSLSGNVASAAPSLPPPPPSSDPAQSRADDVSRRQLAAQKALILRHARRTRRTARAHVRALAERAAAECEDAAAQKRDAAAELRAAQDDAAEAARVEKEAARVEKEAVAIGWDAVASLREVKEGLVAAGRWEEGVVEGPGGRWWERREEWAEVVGALGMDVEAGMERLGRRLRTMGGDVQMVEEPVREVLGGLFALLDETEEPS